MNTLFIALTSVFMMLFYIVFTASLFLALWYIAKHYRLMIVPITGLYIGMGIDWHYILLSDNQYSDVSHGFLGTWNGRFLMLLALSALVLQVYIIFKGRKVNIKSTN